MRQETKLEFQVCSGELIHLVGGCLPVLEDSVCMQCSRAVGVPAAVCGAVFLLQEESVLVSPCTAFVPFSLLFS